MERRGAFTGGGFARYFDERESKHRERAYVVTSPCVYSMYTIHTRAVERYREREFLFFRAVHRTQPPSPRYLKHASGIVSFSSVTRLVKTQRSGSKAGHDAFIGAGSDSDFLFLSLSVCLFLLSFLSFELVFAFATSPEWFPETMQQRVIFIAAVYFEKRSFGGSGSLSLIACEKGDCEKLSIIQKSTSVIP